MGVAMANRVADPVSLEAFVPPCKLIQEGGLFVPYYNASSTLALVAGEPIVAYGRVCIVQKTILPQKMGTVLFDWIVSALLDTAHSGDIGQGDLIYWDTDIDVVTPIDSSKFGTAVVAGIGGASASIPTNGFILGRATSEHYEHDIPLDGSDDIVCATDGSKRVRVVAIPGAPTTYEA